MKENRMFLFGVALGAIIGIVAVGGARKIHPLIGVVAGLGAVLSIYWLAFSETWGGDDEKNKTTHVLDDDSPPREPHECVSNNRGR